MFLVLYGVKPPHSQPAIEGYRVTMEQIFVTSNLSIQICSIDTRDERYRADNNFFAVMESV